jgi:hypothetical protein
MVAGIAAQVDLPITVKIRTGMYYYYDESAGQGVGQNYYRVSGVLVCRMHGVCRGPAKIHANHIAALRRSLTESPLQHM